MPSRLAHAGGSVQCEPAPAFVAIKMMHLEGLTAPERGRPLKRINIELVLSIVGKGVVMDMAVTLSYLNVVLVQI